MIRILGKLDPGLSKRNVRGLPDIMSASEGEGGLGKVDIVREVA